LTGDGQPAGNGKWICQGNQNTGHYVSGRCLCPHSSI
jgi:hypothetical protein